MGVAFDPIILNEGYFGANKINCAASFNGGDRVIYGTDDGLFISDHRETSKHPLKVLALRTVRQVDVLGDDQLLVVLSGHQVLTLPLGALDHIAPTAGLRSAACITSSASLFKVGFCLGRLLVCVIKVGAFRLSTTVKVLELVGRELRIFRKFYIPLEVTSVNYLKTRLCIGRPTGFEIVDLESLETQALLDRADDSFAQTLKPGSRKLNELHPMTFYRINNGFWLKSVVTGKESSFQVDKKRGKEGKVERHCESSPALIPSAVCVAQAPD
ncbi:citron-like protein [Mycena olivaceomarginata]|nr:citron-like protein [Mycena olivaceomarginata]